MTSTIASHFDRQGTALGTPWAALPSYEKQNGRGGRQAAQGYEGRRSDGRRRGWKSGFRATWNVENMRGRSGELAETMSSFRGSWTLNTTIYPDRRQSRMLYCLQLLPLRNSL